MNFAKDIKEFFIQLTRPFEDEKVEEFREAKEVICGACRCGLMECGDCPVKRSEEIMLAATT